MGTQITYYSGGFEAVLDEANPTTNSSHPLKIRLDSGSPSNEIAFIFRPTDTGTGSPTSPPAHSLILSSDLFINITANSSTVDFPVEVYGITKDTSVEGSSVITWNNYSTFNAWDTAGAKGSGDIVQEDGSAKDFGLGPAGERLCTIKTTDSGSRKISINPSYMQGLLDGDAGYSSRGIKFCTTTEGASVTADGASGGVDPYLLVEYSPPLDMSSTGDFQCDAEHERSIEFVNVQNDSESGVGRAIALYGRGQRTWTFKATNHGLKSDTLGAIEWIQDYFEARKGSVEPFYAYVPNAGGSGTGGWDWVKVRFAQDKLSTPTQYPSADAYSVQFSLREVIE